MSDLLTRVLDWLRNPPGDDIPDFAKARALGIPEARIKSMWREAVLYSSPEFEATRIFDNMVAIWEYGNVDDVDTDEVSK